MLNRPIPFWFPSSDRDLRCLRNTIHANLFITYILSGLLWMLTLSLQVRIQITQFHFGRKWTLILVYIVFYENPTKPKHQTTSNWLNCGGKIKMCNMNMHSGLTTTIGLIQIVLKLNENFNKVTRNNTNLSVCALHVHRKVLCLLSPWI